MTRCSPRPSSRRACTATSAPPPTGLGHQHRPGLPDHHGGARGQVARGELHRRLGRLRSVRQARPRTQPAGLARTGHGRRHRGQSQRGRRTPGTHRRSIPHSSPPGRIHLGGWIKTGNDLRRSWCKQATICMPDAVSEQTLTSAMRGAAHVGCRLATFGLHPADTDRAT